MTNHKRLNRAWAAAACFILAFGCFALSWQGGKSAPQSAGAVAYRVDGAALAAEYEVGTLISVPDLYFAADGGEVKAQKTIVTPDGYGYTGATFTPSVMGIHRVEYWARSGGAVFTEQMQFYAYRRLYEATGKRSGAEYTAHALTPSHEGLNVKMSNPSEFVYNNMIDLSAATATDKLISLYVTPTSPGTADFTKMTLKLTDAFDPDNYIQIIVNSSSIGITHGIAYIQAGAAFQPTSGWETKPGKFHRNNAYGLPVTFSFYGTTTAGVSSESILLSNKLELYFDYQNLALLARRYSGQMYTICDFDDPNDFDDLWSGFSADAALLSITITGGSTADFVIDSIYGQDLTQPRYIDAAAPVITVETDGYAVLPDALVNHPYPVFGATALDTVNGAVSVSARVYDSYYQSYRAEYDAASGAFTPDHTGTFYIVYTATDWSGNTAETVLPVTAKTALPAIAVSAETAGRVTSGTTGTLIPVSDGHATGGTGRASVAVTVKDASGASVAADGAFRPLAPGTYTVTYTATDYIGQTDAYSYTVAVTTGTVPIFETEATFPKYFFANYPYTLPALTAYDYTGGSRQAVPAAVSVTDDGGTRTLGPNRLVYFSVDGAGTATVTYTAGAATKTYTVSVHDVSTVGAVDLTNYFALDGVTVARNEAANALAFSASQNGGFEFINPLLADGFELAFAADAAKTAFSKLNLYLTDAADASKSVKLTYRKISAAATGFSINDGIEYPIAMGFASATNAYTLLFSAADNRMNGDGIAFRAVPAFTDGSPFAGFPSGKVYLRAALEGVTGASTVLFKSVNRQPFAAVTDRVPPMLSIVRDDRVAVQLGSTYTVVAATAADVIDPQVTVTLTVTDPDGNPMKATDGTLLLNVPASVEYQIVTGRYGVYRMIYSATDFSGRTGEAAFNISVNDTVPPVIRTEFANKTTANRGDNVPIAPVTVTDDLSAAANIKVIRLLVTPSGKVITLADRYDSFVPTESGTYIIRYAAYDEAGNLAVLDNAVTVA
jgi:hypothetical protein